MTRASYEDQKITNQTLDAPKRPARVGGGASIDPVRRAAPVRPQLDYSVAAPRGAQKTAPSNEAENLSDVSPAPPRFGDREAGGTSSVRDGVVSRRGVAAAVVTATADPVDAGKLASSTRWLLKRGHGLTFLGLFLFTAVLYFRPYELFPAFASLGSLAFWIAAATLLVFLPTQFTLEGNLTARPREVNLVLLLTLTALLSVPFAADGNVAWEEFSDVFIKNIVMFLVMLNVVRTEFRLKSLLWLSFAVSVYLAYHALKDYGSGNFGPEGRIWGAIGGPFGNPNDLALHFATMIPIAAALFFSSRNVLAKPVYLGCALLMAAALVVTFSRGGFLGLAVAVAVFGWKAGRSNRFLFIVVGLIVLGAFVVLAPGGFGLRLFSIYDNSLDTGSASARSALFWRSVYVSAANPVFGIGMQNFPIVGIRNQVSHNAYTQVASELGLAALVIYCLFIITPFKRLLRIERATDRTNHAERRLHFLSIGLQASIVAYAVSSFFGSVAYNWYVYYLVGYALCLDRLYTMHAARTPPGGEELGGEVSSAHEGLSGRRDRPPGMNDSRDALRPAT